MPTIIKFIGAGDDVIEVREDAVTVADAIAQGPGRAELTRLDDGTRLYVNPGSVAYWYDGGRPGRADSGVASSMSPF
jgi:hypothetical protein